MTAREVGSIQKVMGAHVFRGTLINKNRQHFKLKSCSLSPSKVKGYPPAPNNSIMTRLHTKYLIHSTMTFSKTYMISNIIRLAWGKNKTDHETPLKVITGNNVKI